MNNKKRPQSPKLQRMLTIQHRPNHPGNGAPLTYHKGGLYSLHELAERLNAPLGTVKSWARRGLSRLRECLES